MPYSRYYRSRLPEKEKAAYDALCAGFEAGQGEIDLPPSGTGDLNRLMYAVKYDNPQFFYVDCRITVVTGPARTSARVNYRTDAAETARRKREITAEAAPIISSLRTKSQGEKALYLHDRLVRRCSYGEVPGREADAHTIAGALLDNICVCEGYAMAYKYLADLAGVRCMTVCGEGVHPDGTRGPHAWNLVMTDGKCSHVDVTFDQLLAGRYCSRAYYGLSDAELLADHTIDPVFPVPSCPESQSFLPVISGTDRLIEFMRKEAGSGAALSQARLTKGFTLDELTEMVHRKLSIDDYAWYRKLGSYVYAEKSRVLSLVWK